jgi:DmsE family decaheme c-type cytochrome
MNMYRIPLILGVLIAFVLGRGADAADNTTKFKLKPGAAAKLCLDCHDAFNAKLKKAFVHTPVKKDCTNCHNPHSAKHGKLLAADAAKICVTCHASVIPANAQSSHSIVVKGECMKCHDPHSADNKDSLLKQGNALCLDCHKPLAEKIASVKHKHPPVEKGCLVCHTPHASTKDKSLLRDRSTALCVGCHKTDSASFARRHVEYPVAGSRCTGCHDPHGSNVQSILYDNVHQPVAARKCNQCHEEATSATPLKTRKEGTELCRGCHNDMYNKTFDKNRLHWPLLDKKGCLACHNPHATSQKGLLKEPLLKLCGRCHADTIQRQEKSPTKHEPVQSGTCTACHDPHSSNAPFIAKQENTIELCGTCHDWMKHSTHPIGENARDPRNKNLSVQCLSCHRAHGTEYKTMFPFPTQTELCVQCHEQFRR